MFSINLILLAVFLVFCRSALALGGDMPSLPDDFFTVLELNNLSTNKTNTLFQWYDFAGDNIRIDALNEEGYHSQIFDFTNGIEYNTHNGSECVTSTFNISDFGDRLIQHHHIVHTKQLFGIAAGSAATYGGTHNTRGIATEYWTHDFNYTSLPGLQFTASYYFSVESWSMHGIAEHRIPVRVYMIVTNETSGNATHVVADFVNFVPRNIYPPVFDRPSFCKSLTPITLPTLPVDYSSMIEVTVRAEKNDTINVTFSMFDVQDTTNNRGRFEIYTPDGYIQEIVFENFDTRYEITNLDCVAHDNVSHSHDHFFGENFIEGSHVRTLADMLKFGSNYNETYYGTVMIRGIKCDHWKSDMFTDNGTNYQFDYYFSVQDWQIYTGVAQDRVPVRIVVNAWPFNTNLHIITNYEMIMFISGSPWDGFFTIPDMCPTAGVVVPFPTIADDFSTEIEITNVNKNSTSSLFEFYDFDSDKMQWDFLSEHGFTSITFDIEAGLEYYTHNFQCTAYPIKNFVNRSNLLQNGHLMHTKDLFLRGSSTTYRGTSSVRGIATDIWRGHFQTNFRGTVFNVTSEFHFSAKHWKMRHVKEHNIPIRVHQWSTNLTSGEKSEIYLEFINFIPVNMYPEVFERPALCPRVDENPPAPALPDEFATIIEFNNKEFNNTFTVLEWYDYDDNNVRFDMLNDYGTQSFLFDLDTVTMYAMYNNSKCFTTTFDPSKQWFAQTGHLVHTGSLTGLDNATYAGRNFKRNIDVRGWRGVHWVGSDIKIEGLYYFADPSWSMSGIIEHQVPVVFELAITNVTMNRTFNVEMNYVNFVPEEIIPQVFDKPDFCPALVNRPRPAMPTAFRATVEINVNKYDYTATVSEFFDPPNDQGRFEVYANGVHRAEYIFAEDGERYEVTDFENCSKTDLISDSNNFPGSNLLDANHHFRSVADLMNYHDGLALVYMGNKTIRGVRCDHWRAVNGTHSTFDYFYSVADWHERPNDHRIPVLVKAMFPDTFNGGKDIVARYHIVNYIPFSGEMPQHYFKLPRVCTYERFLTAGWVIAADIIGGILVLFVGITFGLVVGSVAAFAVIFILIRQNLGGSLLQPSASPNAATKNHAQLEEEGEEEEEAVDDVDASDLQNQL